MVKSLKIIVIIFSMCDFYCCAMHQDTLAMRQTFAERNALFERNYVVEDVSETGAIIEALKKMHSSIMTNLDLLQHSIATRIDQFEHDVESGFAEQSQVNGRSASKDDVERIDKRVRRLEIIACSAFIISAIPIALCIYNSLTSH